MDWKRHNRDEEHTETRAEDSCGDVVKAPPIQLDHCDLLLDAMDAHLEQLQVVHHHLAPSKERCSGNPEPLRWNKSLSKDTGFESTSQTNNSPMSCLDLPSVDQTSEISSFPAEDSATHQNSKWKSISGASEAQSHREEVMWRLGRLLGDACEGERLAADAHPLPSESICTEDFVRCFREQMVESLLPEAGEQDVTTDAETDRGGKPVVSFDEEITDKNNSEKSQKEAGCMMTDVKNARQPDSSAVDGEDHGAGRRHGSSSAACGSRCNHDKTNAANKNVTKFKFLAGVPLHSFDSVSIDSDLESVCTEQVRNHIHKLSVRRCTGGNLPSTSTPLRKDQQRRKNSPRWSVCSADEDINEGCWGVRPVKASERTKLKDRLSTLRQKCDKQEGKLELKKTYVTEVDLTLTELQLRRKHALQDLEWLAEETAFMEREKRNLESGVKERKAERDVLSCLLQTLHRESESCQLELRRLEEEVAARRRTLNEHNSTCQVVSGEVAETKLFVEQQHAQKKLESMQQMLEETCEELQRLTQAVGSLRSRCWCVQEKLRQENKQPEGQECQAGELRLELDQYKIRVDAQDEVLAQRELQLSEIRQQHKLLLAERNDLKGALQRLEKQLSESEAAMERQMRGLVLNHEQQIKKLTNEAKHLRTSLTEQKEAADEQEEELAADGKGAGTHFTMREVDRMPEQEKGKQLKHPAQELDSECRRLLVEQSQKQHAVAAASGSAEEALTHLRTVRSQVQDLVKHLNRKLDSQKQTIEQLRKEKEEEVITQRQQLMKERKQALDALKRRLIQKHIEELSHLTHACKGGGEGGGQVGSLRKQLKAKDAELQEVQRSMAQWKEQTAARLACKFEEELTSELERCRLKLLRCRTARLSEDRQRHETLSDKASACRHSPSAVDSSSDLASLKLLRHIQTRIKQLRVQSQSSASAL